MNKNYLNIIVIIAIFILTVILFNNSDLLTASVLDSFNIFISKVFPFLFIMIIINELLLKLNLPYYINKVFSSPFIYIFVLSCISGCPTNAIIIKSLLDKKQITTKEASVSLTFSVVNNPLFLYNYFKILFPNHIIVKLFIVIYLLNFITLIFIIVKYKNENIQISKTNSNIIKDFPKIITNSIIKLIHIASIIIFFKLLSDILLPSNNIISSLIKGTLEITQGLNSLTLINTSLKIKELLTIVILVFGGFSIHIQISSILEDYNINYKYFYLSRLFQIILAIILINT